MKRFLVVIISILLTIANIHTVYAVDILSTRETSVAVDITVSDNLTLILNSRTVDIDSNSIQIKNNTKDKNVEITKIEFYTEEWSFVDSDIDFTLMNANSKNIYLTSNLANSENIEQNVISLIFVGLKISPEEEIEVPISGKSNIYTTNINEHIAEAYIIVEYTAPSGPEIDSDIYDFDKVVTNAKYMGENIAHYCISCTVYSIPKAQPDPYPYFGIEITNMKDLQKITYVTSGVTKTITEFDKTDSYVYLFKIVYSGFNVIRITVEWIDKNNETRIITKQYPVYVIR